MFKCPSWTSVQVFKTAGLDWGIRCCPSSDCLSGEVRSSLTAKKASIQGALGAGDQTYASFSRYNLKGVVLELLTPIYKREKSKGPVPWLFSTDGVPPCSRRGWRQVFHLSFLPWPELTCLLPVQVSHYCPSWPHHWGGVEMYQA